MASGPKRFTLESVHQVPKVQRHRKIRRSGQKTGRKTSRCEDSWISVWESRSTGLSWRKSAEVREVEKRGKVMDDSFAAADTWRCEYPL